MTFDEYQYEAGLVSVLRSDEERIKYGVLNTASEAGEIAGKFAKSIRDQTNINTMDVVKEMGDVLWSLSALADGLGVSLDTVAEMNLVKLQDRTKRGVVAGSGDDR